MERIRKPTTHKSYHKFRQEIDQETIEKPLNKLVRTKGVTI
jgi:hypothetical protein